MTELELSLVNLKNKKHGRLGSKSRMQIFTLNYTRIMLKRNTSYVWMEQFKTSDHGTMIVYIYIYISIHYGVLYKPIYMYILRSKTDFDFFEI